MIEAKTEKSARRIADCLGEVDRLLGQDSLDVRERIIEQAILLESLSWAVSTLDTSKPDSSGDRLFRCLMKLRYGLRQSPLIGEGDLQALRDQLSTINHGFTASQVEPTTDGVMTPK